MNQLAEGAPLQGADDAWHFHIAAERSRLEARGLSRETAVACLGAALERLRGLLADPARVGDGVAVTDLHEALAEAEHGHETYLWDEIGLFSDGDVLHSLATVNTLVVLLDGLYPADE